MGSEVKSILLQQTVIFVVFLFLALFGLGLITDGIEHRQVDLDLALHSLDKVDPKPGEQQRNRRKKYADDLSDVDALLRFVDVDFLITYQL